MHSVSKQGRTILFVSHQLGSLSELCNSGLVLNRGRMVHFGGIQASIKTYLELSTSQDDLEQNSSHVAQVEFEGDQNRKKHIFWRPS